MLRRCVLGGGLPHGAGLPNAPLLRGRPPRGLWAPAGVVPPRPGGLRPFGAESRGGGGGEHALSVFERSHQSSSLHCVVSGRLAEPYELGAGATGGGGGAVLPRGGGGAVYLALHSTFQAHRAPA